MHSFRFADFFSHIELLRILSIQGLVKSSGRPKQFIDRNTKTENGTSEKPSFGRNQLIDQTMSVLGIFGQNSIFQPKQSLLAKMIFWLSTRQG